MTSFTINAVTVYLFLGLHSSSSVWCNFHNCSCQSLHQIPNPAPISVINPPRIFLNFIIITEFANRKCELDGRWGTRPNATEANATGWTDYGPCYKPEVIRLMQQMGSKDNLDLYIDIAKRTRTLEIVGLCLSLFALIVSLVIFCTFRSLRNNRTKIHKNLFIAMVLQVIIRLTLYLDQFRRGSKEATTNTSLSVIENTVGEGSVFKY